MTRQHATSTRVASFAAIDWGAPKAAAMHEPTIYRSIRAGSFAAIRIRSRYVIPAAAIHEVAARAASSGTCVDLTPRQRLPSPSVDVIQRRRRRFRHADGSDASACVTPRSRLPCDRSLRPTPRSREGLSPRRRVRAAQPPCAGRRPRSGAPSPNSGATHGGGCRSRADRPGCDTGSTSSAGSTGDGIERPGVVITNHTMVPPVVVGGERFVGDPRGV